MSHSIEVQSSYIMYLFAYYVLNMVDVSESNSKIEIFWEPLEENMYSPTDRIRHKKKQKFSVCMLIYIYIYMPCATMLGEVLAIMCSSLRQ